MTLYNGDEYLHRRMQTKSCIGIEWRPSLRHVRAQKGDLEWYAIIKVQMMEQTAGPFEHV